MKKLLLIAFIITAGVAGAQTTKPIDGFLGIKFGSSQQQVIDALKAKGYEINTNQMPLTISVKNVSLGTRKASTLFIDFVDGKAFEAQFVFKPESDAKIIDYYNQIISDISDAYGPCNQSKKFKPPYQEGDGYEVTAIKTGNADYTGEWKDGHNSLTINITTGSDSNMRIRLYYTDDKLDAVNNQQKKEKNKSDF